MSMSHTPSPTEETLPTSLNDVFEMNPLFRDDNPPFSRDLTLTGISIPEVRIIDRPVDKFNDIERDQIVTLTVEDIAYLQDPIAFGLFKIIEREFTKHFKSLNALREELTEEQLDYIRSKNMVGIIQLYFDFWREIFSPIRNCSRNFRDQLELIQKAHESGREKENTDWIYCARNIFAFFRERHHDLDLEQELNLVVNALNGRAMCHFHGKAPLFQSTSNPQPEDLVIHVSNDSVGERQMQAPRKFIPTNPYDNGHANTSSSPPRIPSYCVNPMDAVESTPEKPKWLEPTNDSDMIDSNSDLIHSDPVLSKPDREIIIADQFAAHGKSKVHRMTASYRTNPLDAIEDEDYLELEESSPPLIDGIPSPTSIAQNINPMDLLDLDSLNRNSNNNSNNVTKKSRKSFRKNSSRTNMKDEAINPEMLARITSEN